jgi:hypothetical protein
MGVGDGLAQTVLVRGHNDEMDVIGHQAQTSLPETASPAPSRSR